MTDNRAELIAAEAKVMEGQSELARLKNEVQNLERAGADAGEKTADLRRLEEEQARLIEIRNALFREVAGNDY